MIGAKRMEQVVLPGQVGAEEPGYWFSTAAEQTTVYLFTDSCSQESTYRLPRS